VGFIDAPEMRARQALYEQKTAEKIDVLTSALKKMIADESDLEVSSSEEDRKKLHTIESNRGWWN